MKSEALHLQILSYLKEQKEIVNLEEVFKEFLDQEQGLLIQDSISECRGKGCFKRMSAILFAINRLQQENQIALAHIDVDLPKNNSHGINKYILVGNTIAEQECKVTGYYQDFLREHILSPIFVSEEAADYINRKGVSKELQQAKRQTCWAIAAAMIAAVSLLVSIWKCSCC